MADAGPLFTTQISRSSYMEFKADILLKLKWSEADWISNNLVRSDRYYFCRSVKHWFSKLIEVSDARYLVFTTFSFGLEDRPSFSDILKAYKQQFGMQGLCGASQSQNNRFIVLLFDSLERRQLVADTFESVNASIIVHSDWSSIRQNIQFQLNWLPPDIPIADIKRELEKHVSIVSLYKVMLDLGDGDFLPSGKVVGTLSAEGLPSLDLLPHFVYIHPYRAHWIIYLRKSICFSCGCEGHYASSCPTPYCLFCHSLLPRDHQCCHRSVSFSATPVLPGSQSISLSTSVPVTSGLPPLVSSVWRTPVLAADGISCAQHTSWSDINPIKLPKAFADLPDSSKEPYLFSNGKDKSATKALFDPNLFFKTMDSLSEMQKETGSIISSLKTLPSPLDPGGISDIALLSSSRQLRSRKAETTSGKDLTPATVKTLSKKSSKKK